MAGKFKLRMAKPRIAEGPPRVPLAGSWRDGRKTAERGYGGAWQSARVAYLREHPLCVYCLRDGHVTPATVVDHKVPHRGDRELFWNQDNWQSLCKLCHDGLKKREEGRG